MAEPGLIIKLYDLQTNELADISGICIERQCSVRRNLPRGMTLLAPAAHDLFTAIADDGVQNLSTGDRKIIAWEEDRDDTPIFHGRVVGARRVGNGRKNLVTIRALDPMGTDFGSESGGAGRLVRASGGNFIKPEFGDPITGADLLYQAFVNSQETGVESDPTPGEGPLPIDIGDGSRFSSTVNLSLDNFMSWPLYIGDLTAKLADTGVLDVDLRPIDPSESLDPYAMVAVSAADVIGSDLSGTVHFDYWTGSHNAKEAVYDEDFSTICNKLYTYLGPPKPGGLRWPDNITPGTAGTTIDPTDSRARYGVFMMVKFDDQLVPSHTDPFALALWNAEMGYRVAPRNLLYVTPRPGSKALFRPFGRDFDAGDVLGMNIGAALGIPALATEQRCLGYDVVWSRNNVARMSQLITAADVSL